MPSSDGGGREGLWWIPVPIKADKLNLLAVLQMFPCDQKLLRKACLWIIFWENCYL